MTYEIEWPVLYAVLRAATGLVIALILAYIVWGDWPLPKPVRVALWAMVWAIVGAVIGMADNEIEVRQGVMLGAIWGALIGLFGLSDRRRKKTEPSDGEAPE